MTYNKNAKKAYPKKFKLLIMGKIDKEQCSYPVRILTKEFANSMLAIYRVGILEYKKHKTYADYFKFLHSMYLGTGICHLALKAYNARLLSPVMFEELKYKTPKFLYKTPSGIYSDKWPLKKWRMRWSLLRRVWWLKRNMNKFPDR